MKLLKDCCTLISFVESTYVHSGIEHCAYGMLDPASCAGTVLLDSSVSYVCSGAGESVPSIVRNFESYVSDLDINVVW